MEAASLEAQLITLVSRSDTIMRALKAASALGLASWCIGAGAIRNLVWDHLHAFEHHTPPQDIDLVFHDASDLTPRRERFLALALAQKEPGLQWDVVNQARVHHWFPAFPGRPVGPLRSLVEGVASWPEVATCVGVTLNASGRLDVIAPYGLDDLFDMIVRWNPQRVTREVFLERVMKKRFVERWPNVKVECW